MHLLETKNLTISYSNEESTVISNRAISIYIDANECVGLFGASGSGKSTLTLACFGLIKKEATLQEGTILFQGEEVKPFYYEIGGDVKDSLEGKRGRDITYVTSNPQTAFNPTVKMGKQIAEAFELQEKNYFKRKERALQFFEALQLPDPKQIYQSYPKMLSGGILQKIMIAMAFVNHPRLVIMDEPFSALDAQTEETMMEYIQKEMNTYGTSILLVSHDPYVLKKLCQRVYCMQDGELIEPSQVNEIENDEIRNVYLEIMEGKA